MDQDTNRLITFVAVVIPQLQRLFRSSCVTAVLWFKESFMQICIFARQVKEGPAAGEFEERNTKLGKRSAGNWVFFVLP